jgi:hypothetical protein
MEQSPSWKANIHSSSQSQSYFATDIRSVSQSILTLSPPGTHDYVLVVVKTVAILFVVGRPAWWEDGSVL